MQLDKILKKAMIDNNIKGAKQLSEMSEISYNKTIRALNGDGSSRLVDVLKLAETMNLEIKFISKGEE
jgi:DNA-binding phage protein